MGDKNNSNMVRIFIDSTKRTVNLRAPGSTLVADVQDTIEHRWGHAVCAQRLICGGRELDPTCTLDELGIRTKETLYLLERNYHNCATWCATGNCKDNNCRLGHTHTVANSPRYIEYNMQNSAMPVDEALLDEQAESWESTEEARQQAYTAFLFARQSKRTASAAAANQVAAAAL